MPDHLTTIMNNAPAIPQNLRNKSESFIGEFGEYIDALYNFAYRLTEDEEEAKDLVQETYYRAYYYFDHYQLGTNPKSWLFRILKNLFINDYHRKSKISFSDYEDTDAFKAVAHNDGYNIMMKSFSDQVIAAFNILPPDLKMIVYLRDLEDLRYDEIQEVLDIPLSTVKTRLHRARNMLRKKLINLGLQTVGN